MVRRAAVRARGRAGTRSCSTCATTARAAARRRPSASRRRRTSRPRRGSPASARPGRSCCGASRSARRRSVLAAADDPAVAGVICDSSYRSLDDTVRHHLQLVPRLPLVAAPRADLADGGPRDLLDRPPRRLRPGASRTSKAAARLRGPARRCSWRTPTTAACRRRSRSTCKAAAGTGAEVLIVPGKSHGGAWRDGTAAYEAAAAVVLEAAAGRVRRALATPMTGPVEPRRRGRSQ